MGCRATERRGLLAAVSTRLTYQLDLVIITLHTETYPNHKVMVIAWHICRWAYGLAVKNTLT